MPNHFTLNRRAFLVSTAAGVLSWPRMARGEAVPNATLPPRSQVALTQGDSRAGNVLEALRRIEPQVRAGLASKKHIIIKPNLVSTEKQLSATHAECLEGTLEFLRSVTHAEISIVETSANGPTIDGYNNFGYAPLAQRYGVKLLDLDELPSHTEYLVNERHHAVPLRYSSFLTDPDAFVISTAPFKTHDRAVVTLGIKNLTVGGILKDKGFRWGAGSVGTSDKHLVHGGPENQGIHYNLFTLSQRLQAHLTVLDGFEGMEGNGPVGGTPVDHRVALASTDFLAADVTAARLMGFDDAKIGYMVFCAQAGMGQTDPEILGPALAEATRSYRPHETIEQQYGWM